MSDDQAAGAAPAITGLVVIITVTCGECDRVLGVYEDSVEEKYPFWCETCGGYAREGKYPWSLTTRIETRDQLSRESRQTAGNR